MSPVLPGRSSLRTLIIVACDTLLIGGSVLTAAYFRFGADAWDILQRENGLWKTALVAAVAQLCLY